MNVNDLFYRISQPSVPTVFYRCNNRLSTDHSHCHRPPPGDGDDDDDATVDAMVSPCQANPPNSWAQEYWWSHSNPEHTRSPLSCLPGMQCNTTISLLRKYKLEIGNFSIPHPVWWLEIREWCAQGSHCALHTSMIQHELCHRQEQF